MVSASNSEMSMAKQMVRPNCFMSMPTMPLTSATGANTESTTSVVGTTASCTSFVPSTAAASGTSPCSILRKMFSRTTMASSMSRPTARLSARREMMFSENPATYIRMKRRSRIGRASAL